MADHPTIQGPSRPRDDRLNRRFRTHNSLAGPNTLNELKILSRIMPHNSEDCIRSAQTYMCLLQDSTSTLSIADTMSWALKFDQ